MHHLVVETYLFQRKEVIREFHEAYPCTYTSFCGYSRVYVDLKKTSGSDSGGKESNMDLTMII